MKEFVTLSNVKINGDYTYLEERAPLASDKTPTYVSGDTWLNLVTGWSYICTDDTVATWVRFQAALDTKIELRKDEVFKNVINYLSNIFKVNRNAIYLDSDNWTDHLPVGLPVGWTRKEAWQLATFEDVFSMWLFNAVDSETFDITGTTGLYGSIEDSFKIGDTIFISGSRRNDGFYTITALDIANNKISVFEEVISGLANAFIYLCSVPDSVIQIAADMVYYDLVIRPKMKGLKSEKIGTYSWVAQDSINGIDYPASVTSGLEAYRLIALGGQAIFVD